jgi:hypothetical protein
VDQAGLGINSRKIPKAKRAGSVAGVVEELSNKCEALSSNTGTDEKTKRKKEGAAKIEIPAFPSPSFPES